MADHSGDDDDEEEEEEEGEGEEEEEEEADEEEVEEEVEEEGASFSAATKLDDKASTTPTTPTTFSELGVVPALCEAIKGLGWSCPTSIQCSSIPEALAGRDIVGLAETGSGKTGAFAIPILQALLANPQRLFAVILAPTRELAFQINEVFEALGASIALHSVCIVGGIDNMTQSIALARKPHIIVATPGRLVDHLQNTKGFSLRSLKFLVMDEADRMLSMDFEEEINQILAVIPRERRTFLFSATMTSKVAKLQKASLTDPVKVEVSNKFQTPKVSKQLSLVSLSDSPTLKGLCSFHHRFHLFLTILRAHSLVFSLDKHTHTYTHTHTQDFDPAVSFHPCEVEGLLPRLRAGRVQKPVDYHLCQHLQQRPARHAAAAQPGLQGRVSARPTLAA